MEQKKKNRLVSGLCALLMFMTFAVGCGAGQTSGASHEVNVTEEAPDGAGETVIEEEETPLALTNPVLDGILQPVAGGTVTYGNDQTTIDASNAAQGYVMVKYAAGETQRIKVQVAGPQGITYTYNLAADGEYDVFPMSQGDGSYKITVFRNTTGTKYATIFSQNISVTLADQLLPFLYPNQYVNFNDNSNAVAKAKELRAGSENELDTVSAVYNYVVQNISYDYDFAANAPTGYLPDVDRTLATGKGICFDYAALMAAMLRSQGIPTKLVIGYTSRGEYHAWISVHISQVGWVNNIISFDGTNWKLMDPTFASTGNSSQQVMDYINNPSNYSEKYCY